MTNTGYTIDLKDVSLRPSGCEKYVLKDITLSIKRSEIVAIVGLNGAGKSSLLRGMAGEIDEGLSGSILVGGQLVDRPINQIIDGVGVVHQSDESDLIDHLTVAQNICIREMLGGGFGGIFANTAGWRRDMAGRLASEAKLSAFNLDSVVGKLSGGLRQMLSVAIAIHLEHKRNPCRALLLDEHTARLDHQHARNVIQYTVEQARASEATVAMVTHRYNDAIEFADRIVVICDGSIKHELLKGSGFTFDGLKNCVEGGA